MFAARNFVAPAAASILMVLAGCATPHGSLSSSADTLARNADALARNSDDESRYSYSRDARELAAEAEDFRRMIDDRRADDRDVRAAFDELSQDYHRLRDRVDRSDSREAQLDFRAVTESYLDVEREMSRYTDTESRRYARDRAASDRY